MVPVCEETYEVSSNVPCLEHSLRISQMQCRDGESGQNLAVSIWWSAWVERTERRVLEAELMEDRMCWNGEGCRVQTAKLASAAPPPSWSRLWPGIFYSTGRPSQLSQPPCLGQRFLSAMGIIHWA